MRSRQAGFFLCFPRGLLFVFRTGAIAAMARRGRISVHQRFPIPGSRSGRVEGRSASSAFDARDRHTSETDRLAGATPDQAEANVNWLPSQGVSPAALQPDAREIP